MSAIRLVAPTGREVVVRGLGCAHVLPRERFDDILVRAAAGTGACFRDGVEVRGPIFERGRVIGVRTREGDVTARWVVAAGGAFDRLATDPRPRRRLDTCLARFEGLADAADRVEMFFEPELAPHYAWVFPEGAGRVNVGLCVDPARRHGRPVRELLRAFLERRLGSRLAGGRPVGNWRGHPIAVAPLVEHHAPPGTLAVGEACRLANEATGEGISYALESGAIAARYIDGAIARDANPRAVAAAYGRALRRVFGIPFILANLFCRFGPRMLDSVVRIAGWTASGRLRPASLRRAIDARSGPG